MGKQTYKLLVADDEYWTREKFRTMIEWKEYGIEFLEPAENGQEVLTRMEQEAADILITDINMPFINGTELIPLVKEKYPDVMIFVVSGHDDFKYVKSALLSGAINYLLKPVMKLDLVSVVSDALERISKQEENRQEARKVSSFIKDREFSVLLEKEESPFMPQINIKGSGAGYSLILIKIHNLKELMAQFKYDMNLLSYTIKKEIAESTGVPELIVFNNIYRSNEFMILTEQEGRLQRKMAVMIVNYFKDRLDSPISVVISEHNYSIESIHSAYVQDVSVLMVRSYEKKSQILFAEEVNEREVVQKVSWTLTKQMEGHIKRYLDMGNVDGLRTLIFNTLGIDGNNRKQLSYLYVRQIVNRICSYLIDYLIANQFAKEVVGLLSLVEIADKAIETLDTEEVYSVLEEILSLSVNSKKEAPPKGMKDVVKRAIHYIDLNYSEELTLSSLAERFCVESSYFSKLFRQVTGDNVTLYIAKKRIEKAKEYMKSRDVNLAEIAFVVGYDDYTYFSKVFRKMEGISPKEYRMEH